MSAGFYWLMFPSAYGFMFPMFCRSGAYYLGMELDFSLERERDLLFFCCLCFFLFEIVDDDDLEIDSDFLCFLDFLDFLSSFSLSFLSLPIRLLFYK